MRIMYTYSTYIHLHTYIYHRRELRAEERAEAARLDAAMAKLSLEAEQERIERVMKLVRNIEHTYIHTYIHTVSFVQSSYLRHTYILSYLSPQGRENLQQQFRSDEMDADVDTRSSEANAAAANSEHHPSMRRHRR